MTSLSSVGKRIAPWRFWMFFAVLGTAWLAASNLLDWPQALLAGFDAAALAFLISCAPTFRYDAKRMRDAADRNDANQLVLLVINFLLTVVILAAIVAEIGQGAQLGPWDKGLIAASLVIVWLFANAVYTLHYCHLFYTSDDGKDCAGLQFPQTREPLMSDFVYFAFTLGVAVQTADVQITSPHIRKVVTAHCVAGFFFNLGVLALTINVLGAG
ncbi:MAG TPA: DUF1345 domain-containing protein [Sphingomicrobium sp.]|jgi:uncharacterized membrane protein|nr:DUF1345 domain-containing protein [Sphingomicrobium sp.]